MQQIVHYGGTQRGVFGVDVQDVSGDLAQALDMSRPRGALVTAVKSGSPADKAGLQVGDVIIRIGKHTVSGANDLHTQLGVARIGEPLSLEILRNGQSMQINATVADPYADYVPGESITPALQGALLGEVVDDSALGLNRGIAVGRLKPDSAAASIGLQEGDVIFRVNRQRVTSLQDLSRILRRSGTLWQIQLRRDDSLLTMATR